MLAYVLLTKSIIIIRKMILILFETASSWRPCCYIHNGSCNLLDSMQESQETALMVAARNGSVGIARKLIQHGAGVNLTNKVLVWWALILCCSCMTCIL